VDLAAPGKYIALHNAKTDMFKGSMRLSVGMGGKVEALEDQTFEPKVGDGAAHQRPVVCCRLFCCLPLVWQSNRSDMVQLQVENNLSLVEFELVQVPQGAS
jgi:hypothetical protein